MKTLITLIAISFALLSCANGDLNGVQYRQVTTFGFYTGPNQFALGYIMVRDVYIPKEAAEKNYSIAAKFAIDDSDGSTNGYDMVATGQASVIAVGGSP